MKYSIVGIITDVVINGSKFYIDTARIDGTGSVENISAPMDFRLPITPPNAKSEMLGKQIVITVEIK